MSTLRSRKCQTGLYVRCTINVYNWCELGWVYNLTYDGQRAERLRSKLSMVDYRSKGDSPNIIMQFVSRLQSLHPRLQHIQLTFIKSQLESTTRQIITVTNHHPILSLSTILNLLLTITTLKAQSTRKMLYK